MGVFGNGGRGIAGVIHQNFLGGDKNAHRSFESLRVKTAGARELHQVQGSQVAGGIVEEDVFRAGVGGVDRRSSLASMPMLDGRVELKAGIAAKMRALGNLPQKLRSVFFLQRLAGSDGASPPRMAAKGGLHELVADANGEILILIHDAPVSIPVVGTVISGVDQSPSLFLLLLFCVDEFFNVAVPIAQGVHFGSAAGFAPRFYHVGYLVVNAQKRQRPAGSTAAAEFLPAGSQGS